MPEPIHQKLTSLKQEFLARVDSAPFKLAEACEALLELIEQNRGALTEAYEVQMQLDKRINALEKVASTYHEPRG